MPQTELPQAASQTRARGSSRPRLGFLGVGWIGLNRMRALQEHDVAEIVVVADGNSDAIATALQHAPAARAARSLDEVLEYDLDGIVIATPSALHAEHATAALRRGLAVFCQKPLARTSQETQQIVDMARRADRLLGVDFSYRTVRGVDQMRDLVQAGTVGEIFAIDLVFHNAYGPDKEWFRDINRAGGGCVIDLGIHLIDLANWIMQDSETRDVYSSLWHSGRLLHGEPDVVEDCAFASWHYSGNAAARLACSWNISAGQDAVIEAVFYGTRGSVALRNVAGSFYDFVVEHREGTQKRIIAEPPDSWGGRALELWTRQLALGNGFREDAVHLVDVARLIDRIYRR